MICFWNWRVLHTETYLATVEPGKRGLQVSNLCRRRREEVPVLVQHSSYGETRLWDSVTSEFPWGASRPRPRTADAAVSADFWDGFVLEPGGRRNWSFHRESQIPVIQWENHRSHSALSGECLGGCGRFSTKGCQLPEVSVTTGSVGKGLDCQWLVTVKYYGDLVLIKQGF